MQSRTTDLFQVYTKQNSNNTQSCISVTITNVVIKSFIPDESAGNPHSLPMQWINKNLRYEFISFKAKLFDFIFNLCGNLHAKTCTFTSIIMPFPNPRVHHLLHDILDHIMVKMGIFVWGHSVRVCKMGALNGPRMLASHIVRIRVIIVVAKVTVRIAMWEQAHLLVRIAYSL